MASCQLLVAATLAAGIAAAQTPLPAPVNAAVSGVVRDAGTGKPLPDYTVFTQVGVTWVGNTVIMPATAKDVKSTTDSNGRYTLTDLPPGPYRIQLRPNGGTRRVTVAGHDLEGIDFNVVVNGIVKGKVLDENKEPLPGMMVFQVSKEYFLGSVGYFIRGVALTNDRGEYTLPMVEAGHPFLLMAQKNDLKLPARSEAPLNPKLRRPVPMRTWYPGSPSADGAAPITLQPGETRERVNIDVKKSPSYCMDGTLETPNGPAALRFSIEGQQPSSGVSGDGGMFMAPPGGVTGPDGKFRICDLYPGTYRLTVTDAVNGGNPDQPGNYAVSNYTISDQDLHNLQIATSSRLTLGGEVVLDGPLPQVPIETKINVGLTPLLRTQIPGEKANVKTEIPGPFTLSGLLIDAYAVRVFLNSPSLYVKDVTFGGRSVLYEPVRIGSTIGDAGMRVIVGEDGATVSAQVADKDVNPVADAKILMMPADAPSEGALASLLVHGETDQTGVYTSHTLRPGKYYVVATDQTFDATPDSIARLWRARFQFAEADLPPAGTAQVRLEAMSIR